MQELFLREWGNEGTVELHTEFSRLIIKTASRTLLGVPCSCSPDALIFKRPAAAEHRPGQPDQCLSAG